MHIDRSRFLLLTASLAALGCDQRPSAVTPDTGASEPTSNAAGDSASEDPAQPSVWLEIEPGSEDPTRPPAGSCDNRVGEPAPCASIKSPGSQCESFHSTQQLCQALPKFMQPRPAEATVDCLLAASGTQRICSWDTWQQCVGAGLQATCVDAQTRLHCQSLSSACGGSVDVFECQQGMSAVTPTYTTRLASCIQEFCEVASCVGDMQYYE